MLSRRHVEVAGDHQRGLGIARGHLGGQSLVEIQLVVELRIGLAVGRVAAGGNVEVVDLDAGHRGGDAAGMPLAADIQRPGVLERQARGDGHAMPALLAFDAQVRQAHLDEGAGRELSLPTLDLLQTDHVRRLLPDEAGDLLTAEADGVDVPGAEAKAHRITIAANKAPGRRSAGRAYKVVSHAAAGRG